MKVKMVVVMVLGRLCGGVLFSWWWMVGVISSWWVFLLLLVWVMRLCGGVW